jgi:hypothetical protein
MVRKEFKLERQVFFELSAEHHQSELKVDDLAQVLEHLHQLKHRKSG